LRRDWRPALGRFRAELPRILLLAALVAGLGLAKLQYSPDLGRGIDGHYGPSSDFGDCDDAGTPGVPADDFCAADPGTLCPNGVIEAMTTLGLIFRKAG